MANFCGTCGSPLDPQTGSCPKCDLGQQARRGRKQRSMRPFIIILAIIVILVTSLGAICGLRHLGIIKLPSFLCLHEWQDATCTSPKTCILCGKTEGEALDHGWQAATCTTMQSCRVCGATKGTPLGHTPGQWDETVDILNACQHRERVCTVCGTVLNSDNESLASFIRDDLFLFSPREYIERFAYFAKQSYPNFRYTIGTDSNDNMDEILYVSLFPEESSQNYYGLSFVGANGYYLTKKDVNTSGILGVRLGKMCQINVKTGDGLEPIDFKLAEAFYQACDPGITEDDLYSQQVMHLCTFANWMDFSEPSGQSMMNDIQYVFEYAISKLDDDYIDAESIQANAAKVSP